MLSKFFFKGQLSIIKPQISSFLNLKPICMASHTMGHNKFTQRIPTNSRNLFSPHMKNLSYQKELQLHRLFCSSPEGISEKDSLIMAQSRDERSSQRKFIPWYKKKSYWFFVILFGGIAILYILPNRDEYRWCMKGFLYSLRRSNSNIIPYPDPLFWLRLLTYIMTMSPDVKSVFAEEGGVPPTIDWIQSKTFVDDEEKELVEWYAVNCFCLIADGSKETREIMCTAPDIVKYMMNLTRSKNSEIATLSMQWMYLCLSSQKFKDQFMENKGLKFLIKWSRSSKQELSHLALNLMGIFFISHPTMLKSMKRNLTDKDQELIYQALYYLGETYNQAGEYKLSLDVQHQLLVLATTSSPYNAPVLTQIAVQLKNLGRLKEANEYFEKSLSSNPYQIETAYNFASDMLKKSDDEKTLKKVTEIIDLGLDELKNPRYPGAPHPHPIAAKAFSLIVKSYLRLEDLESALEKAEEWALECDADPDAHFFAGYLNEKQEYYEEALRSLNHAIRLRPDRIEAHISKAQCFKKMGEIDSAIKSYRDAMQWVKDSPKRDDLTKLYADYASLLSKHERWQEALEVLTELRNQPNYVKQYQNKSNIINININETRALCLEKLGKIQEAYTAFIEALESPTPRLLKNVRCRVERCPSRLNPVERQAWKDLCSKYNSISSQ